ncbi:hypothetical protein BD626DRAFT_190067 [Schizophyllum amplum]|uniref:Aip3p/Bud6 N-terminal domain-containing protein n=1 Tax=Schizophyllum amplum TaxID=97359 RepID=A0A550C003_9AGAR|nr:hypothetical protein BD626DRAFT_190067 [Auriculariopsis ampla]
MEPWPGDRRPSQRRVRPVGTDFNLAVTAFAHHNIELRCVRLARLALSLACLRATHPSIITPPFQDIPHIAHSVFSFALFAHTNARHSDMHSIPAELRVVLERCLAQEPSSEALARHMPGIRTVIYRLLQGLQRSRARGRRSAGGRRAARGRNAHI